jgi:RimJ/RimL family protein N-acetyltransferase
MATHMPSRLADSQVMPRPVARAIPVVESDWRKALPVLHADGVTLRELRMEDAASLLALLTSPPTTIQGFERFIAWTQREREFGRYICFAVVPDGYDTAVGLFQVRQLDPAFGTAEWGFALGSEFWGTGLFTACAEVVVDFAFDEVGVHRLEARAVVENGRGNGALRKIGAIQEGILRKAFLRGGRQLDQALWSLLPEDRSRSKAVWG